MNTVTTHSVEMRKGNFLYIKQIALVITACNVFAGPLV
jgi:hypothetical protein